jgi:hypothetical protein
MFLEYKHRDRSGSPKANRFFSVFIAVLIACVLLGHTFDSCAAHLGAFASAPISVAQISEHCAENSVTNCEICNAHEKQHEDGCDSFAEIAVLNSSQHHSDHHAVTIITNFAIIPAAPQLLLLSGSFDSRAGPIFAAPISTCLRSSLPARAPPLSI